MNEIEAGYLDPSAICVPLAANEEDTANMTISVRQEKRERERATE